KGAYAKVISVSTQTLKLASANAQAHILLGKAYYETEQMEKAVSEFKIVLKGQPDNEEIKKLLDVSKIEKVTVKEMGLWKSDYFIIDFDSEDEQQKKLVRAVLIALENAYENIGKDLHFYPDTRTKVFIYSREEYAKLKGVVEWSIGLYKPDTKEILISLYDVEKQPMELILSTLWHETTHLFIDVLTKGNCPLWLNEGFAEYQENKKAKAQLSWKPVKKAVQKGSLYTLKELESSFMKIKDKDRVNLAYLQSLAAVEYIISKYDLRGLRKIFKELGQGRAINEALIIGTKSDYENLERNYKNYLKKEYSLKKRNEK
ncbi:MAG: hypothetical protein KAV18_05480, partial [Candidatus Omnitrophica bacterium]|nr:hypothetical protein [Candidatus Omnitrophota bacterium]